MTSTEFKKLIYSSFRSLKKPAMPWTREPITCRDAEYATVAHNFYVECDNRVWIAIEASSIVYGANFPDCDDFSDIKLGLFKLEWVKLILDGSIPAGTQPSYGVCDGYSPGGENHDFNIFRSDRGLWISDYGSRRPIDGYRPIYMRF